jgi:hypothetical protein
MYYRVSFCLFSLLLASITSQARPLAKQPGWAATISLNAGYVSSQSQFSSDDSNQITDNLNNSGEKNSSLLIYPLLRIQYTTQDLQSQFFLGSSRENLGRAQFQHELGYTQQLSRRSQLTLAYFPELPWFNETWEDPFLTGGARNKTDENYQGGRIKYKSIADSPFTLQYAYGKRTVKNERSGFSLFGEDSVAAEALNRNANLHRLEGEMYIDLAKSFSLSPALLYTTSHAQGSANDYDDYSIRLNSRYKRQKHLLTLNLKWGHSHYSAGNPVFDNQIQKDAHLSLFAIYVYQQPFSWKNTRFNMLTGYNQTDSNINFYNNKSAITSLGFAYSF